MEYVIPILFFGLVGILLAIIRQVPEKSAMLTGLGIGMTFIIGLCFVMLIPSFNENWSQNTAKDAAHYHAIYTTDELAAAQREDRAPHPYTGQTEATQSELVGYTIAQQHGRRVYQREGCMYCHSQQIRPLTNEITRYSIGTSVAPPADEREYIWDQPHFLGTRRIGPDLSREGGKYSDDWHYSHFLNPRQMVAGSIMPVFTWLFDKDQDGNYIPNQDGRDLVAYVQTLGYGRQVFDASLNGGKGGWRPWLKPEDEQVQQAKGQTQVDRAAQPVYGHDQPSSTNRVSPSGAVAPARTL